jgi:YHS domain-containing protein
VVPRIDRQGREARRRRRRLFGATRDFSSGRGIPQDIGGRIALGPQFTSSEEIMRTDPVCGMEVDENKTPQELRSEHLGHYFYFCSKECKEAFDRSPQQYISPPAA